MDLHSAATQTSAVQHAIRSTRPGFNELMQAHDAMQSQVAMQQPAIQVSMDTPEALIASHFNTAYYLASNEDVRHSVMDPLEHFLLHGAAELRDPNAWFDTGFYVRTNPDVVDADVNPFWHYLAHGKAEGRKSAPQRQADRATLARAVPASARWIGVMRADASRLALETLRPLVAAYLPDTAGITVSVSHDRYTHSVGGVQILVADEQAAFNRQNEAYFHIAPAAARLLLAPANEGPFLLYLTINGAYAGLTTYDDLTQVLAELAPEMPAVRRFVVRCLLGHQVDPLITLHFALCPTAAVFWANDYEAICVGFNLLRNDVSFCGGPPPGSMACRVCVYSDDRDAHLRQLNYLFAAIPFHVVVPSNTALAIWNDAARLPHTSVQVHEYVRIQPSAIRSSLIGATSRGTADNPVRIAFVGYAMPHKGWPAFVEIAAAIEGLAAYEAFHLTALPTDPVPSNVQSVVTKVLPGARGAMTDALVAKSIDLVLVLSTWPETFCLVAYEAIASGADVITLPGSGNVAEMVLASGRGLVMPDTASIINFLTSGAAIEYVRMCGDQGSEMGRVESRGMTATLVLPDAPLVPRSDPAP